MNIAPLPVTVLALLLSCSALQAFGSFDEAMAEGRTNLDSKGYEEAKGAFASALELSANPDQRVEAQSGLMNTLLESGDYEGCRKLAEETLEDYHGALGWPQAKALKSIAESYRRESLTDEMEKTMQRADSMGFNPGVLAWLELTLGDMYYKDKNWDASKAAYLEVTEMKDLSADDEGTQAWAFYWLARINKEGGSPDEAVECARKVLALNPSADLVEHVQNLLPSLGASEN